jgi:frataxin-like iron-binding protein CyaY
MSIMTDDEKVLANTQASLLPVWVATPDVNVNFLYNVIHGKNGKAH